VSSTAIATVVKMMESLPERAQQQAVEHLRQCFEGMQVELRWDALFEKTQPQLIAAAARARQQIAEGMAKPMDYNEL
jgi:hypothetical protein